jgi:hypothetical protein
MGQQLLVQPAIQWAHPQQPQDAQLWPVRIGTALGHWYTRTQGCCPMKGLEEAYQEP